MKSILAITIAFTITASAAELVGRYQIVPIEGHIFKLDTATGRTWRLQDTPMTWRLTNRPPVQAHLWVETYDTTTVELMHQYRTNQVFDQTAP